MKRNRRTILASAAVTLGLILSLVAGVSYADEAVDENTRPADGTNCEPAFVVQNYAGVNGSLGYVSAGHCYTPGKAAFGVGADKDFEIIPLDVNRLSAPTAARGQELRSANHFRAGWHNGDTFADSNRADTRRVTSIGAVGVGAEACRFGGRSWAYCGRVVRDDYAPSYVPGAHGFYLLDFPCVKGDSGAAVMSGETAIGIISGRRTRDGACIVSRLDRVSPGMSLYQPPALDARYQLYAKLDGTWYPVGSPVASRSLCLTAAAAQRVEFRCVPA